MNDSERERREREQEEIRRRREEEERREREEHERKRREENPHQRLSRESQASLGTMTNDRLEARRPSPRDSERCAQSRPGPWARHAHRRR
jgi:hypothetical protein